MKQKILTSFALACGVALGACQVGDDGPTSLDDQTPEAPSPTQQALSVEPFQVDLGFDPSTWPASEDGSLLAPAGGGMKYVVDDDGVECPDRTHATIQAAVDAAAGSPGKDKIEICPGEYTENVTIGPGANPLDIKGDGSNTVTVVAPAGSRGPIFDIMGAGEVDIEKLTADGRSTMGGGIDWGIRYINTDGKVKDVRVLNIRNAPGNAQGIGVAFISSGGSPENKLEKSEVRNFTRVGVFVNGLGQEAEVKKNIIQGHEPPRVWAANGIQLSRGSVTKAEDNEIHDAISGNPPGGLAAGILFFCAGPSEAKKNEIRSSDVGILFGDSRDGLANDNAIWDMNNFGILFEDTPFSDDPRFGCPMVPTPTTNNLAEKNDVWSTFLEGILFDGVNGNYAEKNRVEDAGRNGMRVRTSNENVLSKNKVERSDAHGIRVDQSDDNRIEDNDFKESGRTGIRLFASDDNVVEKNKVDSSGDEGILVFDNSEGNLFEKNDVKKSGTLSCDDNSIGGGTAGTANTWEKNKGEKPSDPPEICAK